jgi:hypothetical protein
MDIDSFNQCLTYTANLGNGKSIDKIITAPTTMIGVIIGFTLNVVRESWKKRKENSNKKTCILEDVKRAQSAVHETFTESLKMIDTNNSGESISGHRLPPKIDIMLIEEYFTSIAHTYTSDERTSILALVNLIGETNEQLASFRGRGDPLPYSTFKNAIHNLLNHACYCSALCESFFDGGKKPDYNQLIVIADKLGVNSEFIELERQCRKESNAKKNADVRV